MLEPRFENAWIRRCDVFELKIFVQFMGVGELGHCSCIKESFFHIKVGGYSYQTGSRILSLLVLFLQYERHKQIDQETFQEKIVK
jgi:hypothetical protein